jgi:hypothetical protein
MNDDSNWLARAGIEHRVAAMYEEALRRIADTEQLSADVYIARKALARAAEVGQRAVVEFEASREQMIKLRRDTIEECAQHLEQRLSTDNLTGKVSAAHVAGLIRALVPTTAAAVREGT